jgi:hypothetical protein
MQVGRRCFHNLRRFKQFHLDIWKQVRAFSVVSRTMASVTGSDGVLAPPGESIPGLAPACVGSGGVLGVQPGEKTISEGMSLGLIEFVRLDRDMAWSQAPQRLFTASATSAFTTRFR